MLLPSEMFMLETRERWWQRSMTRSLIPGLVCLTPQSTNALQYEGVQLITMDASISQLSSGSAMRMKRTMMKDYYLIFAHMLFPGLHFLILTLLKGSWVRSWRFRVAFQLWTCQRILLLLLYWKRKQQQLLMTTTTTRGQGWHGAWRSLLPCLLTSMQCFQLTMNSPCGQFCAGFKP